MFHNYVLHYCRDPLKDKMQFYHALLVSALVITTLCMVSNGKPNPGVTVNVNLDIDINTNKGISDRSVSKISKKLFGRKKNYKR